MSQEQLRVLEMVRAGQVAPAEALALLRALDTESLPERLAAAVARAQQLRPAAMVIQIQARAEELKGRRQRVAVLALDIAPVIAMADRAESSEWNALMDECLGAVAEIIYRYEGSLDRVAEDALLAFFGVPIAMEDCVARALRAALELRGRSDEWEDAGGHPLRLRATVHCGEVEVHDIRESLQIDCAPVGDTAALAQRLLRVAGDGQILVSARAHESADEQFRFRELDPIKLAGRREPVEAYEVVGPGKAEATGRSLTPFVGRDRELRQLREALGSATSGRGRVVGVRGAAGVGKSRLAYEFRQMAEREGARWLEGRPYASGKLTSYLPFAQILRAWAELGDEDHKEHMRDKLVAKATQIDPELADEIPYLWGVFGLPPDDAIAASLTAENRREAMHRAVTALLIAAARQQPLVLAIEDLQWLDEASHELLARLIGSLTDAPMLVLLLYRPELEPEWGEQEGCSEIALAELSGEDSTQLMRSVLDLKPLPAELERRVLDQTGGNPFYVEEVIRTLVESGALGETDAGYELTVPTDELELPGTLHDVIRGRIERLEANVKKVLQVASVAGREFAYRLLQQITDVAQHLDTSLADLKRAQMVYQESLLPEIDFIFKHAVTQEVAYSSILEQARRRFHRQAAEALENLHKGHLENVYEALAYHYTQADDVGRAVKYMQWAAHKAQRSFEVGIALGHLDAALALVEGRDDEAGKRARMDLLDAKGHALQFRRPKDEQLAYFEQSLALAEELGDRRAQASKLLHLAVHFERPDGRPRALELYRELGDKPGEGDVLMSMGSRHMFEHEPGIGREMIGRARELLAEAGSWSYEAVCRAALQVLDETGDKFGTSELVAWGATCEVIRRTEDAAFHAGQPGFSTGGGHYFYAPLAKRALNVVGSEWCAAAQAKTFFRRSLPLGEELVANSFSYGYHPLRSILTMEANADTVTVRAGTFHNCLRVRTVTTDPHEEPGLSEHHRLVNRHHCGTRAAWYAPGVGPVKIEVHSADGTKAVQELIAYSADGDEDDYWPLAVGNTWEYAPAEAPSHYQIRCVYRVTAQEKDRHYVAVCRHTLNRWLAHAKQGELEEAAEVYPGYYAFEGQMTFEMLDELRELELKHFSPDQHERFKAFCRRALAGIDRGAVPCHLRQWHVAPATSAERLSQVSFVDDLDGELDESWQPVDPRGQSQFCVGERPGWLRITSGADVDLWPKKNLDAPRLVRKVEGDFAAETRLEITDVAGRTFAGLILWQDEQHFLRFEQRLGIGNYSNSVGEMFFELHLPDGYRAVGRGLLDASVVTLRLEREGNEIRALCRGDGEWQTCGKATIELAPDLLVGIHAFPQRGDAATAWFDHVRVLKPGG